MKRVELLAPAGDLDRLKLALIYGADAVYIGGKEMSLRSHASNFTLEDIDEAVKFAHNLNKKVYVTCNMIMHNEDKKQALEYLRALKKCQVDGIITSSLDLINLNNKFVGNEMHISTQLSTLNEEAIKYYQQFKITRVVLGRECSIKEIKEITAHTPVEIEVFIHGGMCSSYSGKCMLSNVMTLRDANRGGCAHSCRWKYFLYNDQRKINKKNEYFAMSSKDLCAIRYIPALIKAGVASLKIEGRMKSYNYLASIISAYRKCIDDYYAKKKLNFKYYYELMSYGENRLTGHGFLNGEVTPNEQLFVLNDEFKNAGDFIGIVRGYDDKNGLADIEIKNKIVQGEEYLKISPLYFEKKAVGSYTIAKNIVQIKTHERFKPYDIIHARKLKIN